MYRKMIKAGDIVTFTRMPEWVSSMPSDSRSVIRACLGKRFRVTEIDGNGLCVLDVTELIDPMFGGIGNDIRVESEFLRKD